MNLNELNFHRLGSWSIRVRVIALIAIFLFTLILGCLFLVNPRLTQLHNLEKQQSDLKSRYQSEYPQVSVLPEYKNQLVNMQKTITMLSMQLTSTNEIPPLIDTIAKLAVANNLVINLIKPEKENVKNFYNVMSINIAVAGDYHHLALFISQLSALQKILTFDDFTITGLNRTAKDDSDLTLLEMNVTAKVYTKRT